MFLRCLDHTPPLQAEEESGQHYYDLKDIFADIKGRETIVKAWEMGMIPQDYFRRRTASFLAAHPKCNIDVVSEYGQTMTEKDAE